MFDGDIILTTDNKNLIEAIIPDLPIITYEKQKAKDQRINFDTLANMDVKSFNSPIGGITNLASNLFALKDNFEIGSKERTEIEKRIRLLRRSQGDAIDLTKGISYTPPPSKWSKRQRYLEIPENATEKEIKEIEEKNKKIFFDNSICCSKKAYFFGYVYPKIMNDYEKHKKIYNNFSYAKFGMSINDLIKIVDKSPEQKNLITNYYRHSPLFNSKSTMNILCKYIENYDLDFKYRKPKSYFDYTIYMTKDIKTISFDTIASADIKVKYYRSKYHNLLKDLNVDREYLTDEEREEIRKIRLDYFFEEFKNDLLTISSSKEDIINSLIFIFYSRKNYPVSMLWYCFGDEIFQNIKNKSNHRYKVISNENGSEYFGIKCSLVDEYKGE